MKIEGFLVILFAVFVQATFFEKEQNQCINELKLDAEVINAIDKEPNITLPNEDYGKMKACVYTKKGFLTHRGRILWEACQNAILEALKEKREITKNYSEKTIIAEVRKIIKACKRQNFVVDKIWEVATKLRNCLLSFESSQGFYIDPNAGTTKISSSSPNPESTSFSSSLPSLASESSTDSIPAQASS